MDAGKSTESIELKHLEPECNMFIKVLLIKHFRDNNKYTINILQCAYMFREKKGVEFNLCVPS